MRSSWSVSPIDTQVSVTTHVGAGHGLARVVGQ